MLQVRTRGVAGCALLALVVGCLTALGASSTQAASSVLGGPSHNAYSASPLGGDLAPAWSRTFPGAIGSVVTYGGRAFVTTGDAGHRTLWAVRLSDGRRLWAVDTAGAESLTVDDGVVVTGSRADLRVRAYRASDGRVLWSRRGNEVAALGDVLAPGNGLVYLASSYSTVRALDLHTGRVVWRAENGYGALGSHDGERLYVFSYCGVSALDPLTGDELWTNHEVSCQEPHPPSQGRVMVTGFGDLHEVTGHVLDPATGRPTGTWRSDTSPVRTPSSLVTVVGGALHSVGEAGHPSSWDFTGDGHLSGSPLVAGDRVYAGSSAGRLYEVALEGGRLLHDLALPEGYAAEPRTLDVSMSVTQGTLLVPTGSTLSALRADPYTGPVPDPARPVPVTLPSRRPAPDGGAYLAGPHHNNVVRGSALAPHVREAWSVRLSGHASAPLVVGDRVVVLEAGRGSRIRAYHRRTGRPAWVRALPTGALGSAVAVRRQLYVTTDNGRFLKIDAHTGSRRWTHRLPTLDHSTWEWRGVLTAAPATAAGRGGPSAPEFLYSASGDNPRTFALDRRGRLRWFVIGGSEGAVAVDDDAVYYGEGCSAGRLDRRTGQRLWATNHHCVGGRTTGSAVLHRGVLYHQDGSAAHYAIDTRTGQEREAYSSAAEPVVWGSLMWAVQDGTLLATDLRTRRLRWSRPGISDVRIAVVGSRVYATRPDGTLLELSARSGRVLGARHPRIPLAPVATGRLPLNPPAVTVDRGTLAVTQGDRLAVYR